MANHEDPGFDEIGRAVKNTVHRVIYSPEMEELKQAVRQITQEVSHEVKNVVREAARDIPTGGTETPHKPKAETPYVYDTPKTAGLMKSGSMAGPKGRGIALGVVGIVGTAFSAAMSIPVLVGILLSPSMPIFTTLLGIEALLLGGGVLGFSAMIKNGFRKSGMAQRFEQYRQVIGNDRICPIGLLAETTKRTIKQVRKDLQWMMRKGWFAQAKLDKEQTTLILDSQTYMQYLEAMKKTKAKPQPAPEAKTTPKAEEKVTGRDPELEATLQEGQQYIQRIRAANDLIAGEEISRKIDRIEQICTKIFYYVEQHPQKLPELRRFMQYYLPTTLKLLETYCRFEAQPVQGENIRSTKQEIETTLDTIVLAFENLLDSLFEAEALDITTDISALEAMLAQEGLTGSDFKKQLTNEE